MAALFRKVRWSAAAIINFHSVANSRNISWRNRFQGKNTLSLEYGTVLYFKFAIDFILVLCVAVAWLIGLARTMWSYSLAWF